MAARGKRCGVPASTRIAQVWARLARSGSASPAKRCLDQYPPPSAGAGRAHARRSRGSDNSARSPCGRIGKQSQAAAVQPRDPLHDRQTEPGATAAAARAVAALERAQQAIDLFGRNARAVIGH